jgi:RES domain-containing protein
MRIYRICRDRHAPGAFTGEGARRFGGRWNSRGVPMVYASSSLALAAIELFVHLEPAQAPADLVSIAATLPDGEPARTIDPPALPPDWPADPAGKLRAIGDQWMTSLSSLALLVPSVPIRQEWNILVNPLHPRISELRIDPPQPFLFDARMFGR